jgi:hypothetical protein
MTIIQLPAWPEFMSAESLPTVKRPGFPARVVKSRLDALLAEGRMAAIGLEK